MLRLHPFAFEIQSCLADIDRYAEAWGPESVNAVVMWCERRFPDYLIRHVMVTQRIRTRHMLETLGFGIPEAPRDVIDYADALTPANYGFSGPVICRILDAAWKLYRRQPRTDAFATWVDRVSDLTLDGPREHRDWLRGLGIPGGPDGEGRNYLKILERHLRKTK